MRCLSRWRKHKSLEFTVWKVNAKDSIPLFKSSQSPPPRCSGVGGAFLLILHLATSNLHCHYVTSIICHKEKHSFTISSQEGQVQKNITGGPLFVIVVQHLTPSGKKKLIIKTPGISLQGEITTNTNKQIRGFPPSVNKALLLLPPGARFDC